MAWESRSARSRLFYAALVAIAMHGEPPSSIVAAQDEAQSEKLSAEQVERKIAEIEAEIRRLQASADAPAEWKELRAVEENLQAIDSSKRQEAAPLIEKRDELKKAPKVVRWSSQINAKNGELRELSRINRRLVLVEGAELAERRHAELKQLAPKETPELKRLGLDAVQFPTIDGSTSAEPLATVIACRYFDLPYQWIGREQRLEFDRNTSFERDIGIDFGFYPGFRPEPEAQLNEYTLRATATNPRQVRLAAIVNNLIVTNASTHQAYLNVITGESDIGLFARPPAKEELADAEKLGVSLDVRPCARDALIFIVNRNNPVRSLTTEQIRDIYTGKIQSWKIVGGADQDITNYEREETSGSQQLMRSLIMKDTPFFRLPNYRGGHQLIGNIMSHVYLELSNDREGLAYSVFYYEQFMSGSPRTKLIAVDGVHPTRESIASGEYPYVTDVLVVTRKGLADDAPAARLRSWLLSEEGQSVVQESGYVQLAAPRAKSQPK